MKHFPILGSLAVLLGGLLASHTGWASGDALNLPANLGGEFLLFTSQGFLGVDLGEVDSDRAKDRMSALKQTFHALPVLVAIVAGKVGQVVPLDFFSFFTAAAFRMEATQP